MDSLTVVLIIALAFLIVYLAINKFMDREERQIDAQEEAKKKAEDAVAAAKDAANE